jgi:hypothetical protein
MRRRWYEQWLVITDNMLTTKSLSEAGEVWHTEKKASDYTLKTFSGGEA